MALGFISKILAVAMLISVSNLIAKAEVYIVAQESLREFCYFGGHLHDRYMDDVTFHESGARISY